MSGFSPFGSSNANTNNNNNNNNNGFTFGPAGAAPQSVFGAPAASTFGAPASTFGAPAMPPFGSVAFGGSFGPTVTTASAGGFGVPNSFAAVPSGGGWGTPNTFQPTATTASISAKQLPVNVEDSLSGLAWSPTDALAVSSWDGSVSVMTFSKLALSTDAPIVQATEHKLYPQKAPVLDLTWSLHGNAVITCSAANNVASTDVATGTTTIFGSDKPPPPPHAAPVKCIASSTMFNGYVSGSWDQYACLWSAQGVCERRVPLPERCYALATRGHWLVLACANRHVRVLDMRQLDRPFRDMLSPLKFQSRAVDVATNLTWFAIASVEGRCSVVHFDAADGAGDFTFKCHRVRQNDVYPVNDVHFHPTTGAFATVGNDGVYNFWDKESRNRLKSHDLPNHKGLIRGRFNHDGSLFGIASSYDWSQGPNKYYKDTAVFVHSTTQQETTLRPQGGRRH